MSKVCQITGKSPMYGCNVSHANNRTKRRFEVNLHKKRFWVPSRSQYVSLVVSAKGMRIIDKYGIEVVLKKLASNNKSFAQCAKDDA